MKNPIIVCKTNTDKMNGYRRCPAWMHPMNPDGTIQTDEKGNRLPRVLDKSHHREVYYFYRKGQIPFHGVDELTDAHVGDRDYVQEAPETDPEEDNNNNE